jgi:hypothetical protein
LYSKVRFQQIYPGIDLVYYGNQRRLESDFVVSPHADALKIRMAIDGAEASLNDSGDLELHLPKGDFRFRRPVSYQDIDGIRKEVPSSYVLEASQVSLKLGEYDHTRTLVIDPQLEYSTFLGGSGDEQGNGIAVDSSGNAYVTGFTTSSDFPTTAGVFQSSNSGAGFDEVFVTKIDPTGTSLIYSTYLGGSGNDTGYGIAVDSSGNAYVTGESGSNNFPTTPGVIQPAPLLANAHPFVTKLNATGSALVYSTYLGGSSLDYGYGIAVDGSGNAFIVGGTQSDDFPTTAGAFQTNLKGQSDAFVAKVNSTGTALLYSTYLGGTGNELCQSQGCVGLAIDSTGSAYVAGFTTSTDFPITAGAFQTSNSAGLTGIGFVSKLNAAGSALVYSSYLGSSNGTVCASIAVDTSGDAYVTGDTESGFPITPGALDSTDPAFGANKAFVTEFNPTGTALIYSTYLGGNSSTNGSAVVVDTSGNAYVTGTTMSSNFPTTSGALRTSLSGASDAFVSKLNPTGSALIYSTYLGGGHDESGQWLAITNTGDVYVTGSTSSSDFPTTAGAFQTTKAGATGSFDAFVTRITPTSGPGTPGASLTPSSLIYAAQAVGTTSSSQSVTLTNTGTATLTINSVTLAGTNASDFSVTNSCGASLAAGANCSIGVTFKPTASGARTATLSVSDNASSSPQTVSLSGSGIAPAVSLAPATLNFAATPLGSATAAQTVTLTNTGTDNLTISSISVSGTNAADFSETNACGATLSAGANCAINVKMTPSAGGNRSATLSVADNASGSPHSVALSGSGQDFSLSASPTSAVVTSGGTATFNISVIPASGGFTNGVTLGASGLPTGATSAFSANPVTPGSSTGTSTLTIQVPTVTAMNSSSHATRLFAVWAGPFMLVLPFGLQFKKRRSRKVLTLIAVLTVLVLSLALSACDGGFPGRHSSTSFTVTVTGTAGSQQHTTSMTLTVQ